MNSHEFDHDEQNETERTQRPRDERSLSWKMLDLSSELATILDRQTPYLSYDEFSFSDDRLRDIEIPEYIQALCLTRHLDEIQLDFRYQKDNPNASIIIRFIVKSDEDEIIVQFESPQINGEDYVCHTTHLSHDSEEVRTVKADEIKVLLASLILPSVDSDRNRLAMTNLLSSQAKNDLLALFDAHANTHFSEREYTIESLPENSFVSGSIKCYSENGELQLTEVSRTVSERLGVNSDGSLIDEIRRITTQIELGNAKNIGGTSFYIEEGREPSSEFQPTTSDFIHTIRFMEQLLIQNQADDVFIAEMDPNTFSYELSVDEDERENPTEG
jgi:hypothetical protein